MKTGEATGNLCLGTRALVRERVSHFLAGLASRKDEVKRRCRTVLQSRAEGLLRSSHPHSQRHSNAHSILALVQVIRLKGNPVIHTSRYRAGRGITGCPKAESGFCGRAIPAGPGGSRQSGPALGAGHREPWHSATALDKPQLAVRMYRRQNSISGMAGNASGWEQGNPTSRLQRLLAALLRACGLLILAGILVSAAFRRRAGSRARQGIPHLGWEYYLAAPDPPPQLLDPPRRQTGYA